MDPDSEFLEAWASEAAKAKHTTPEPPKHTPTEPPMHTTEPPAAPRPPTPKKGASVSFVAPKTPLKTRVPRAPFSIVPMEDEKHAHPIVPPIVRPKPDFKRYHAFWHQMPQIERHRATISAQLVSGLEPRHVRANVRQDARIARLQQWRQAMGWWRAEDRRTVPFVT